MAGVIAFSVINKNRLSSHMKQLSQYINLTNHNINSFDQIIKIIFVLDNNKGIGNYNSSSK